MAAAHGPEIGGLKERGLELYLDSSTLPPLLKRLESAGLVERQRNAADQRQVHVALTAQGRALRAKAGQVPACVFSAAGGNIEALSYLTKELAQLRAILDAGADQVMRPDMRDRYCNKIAASTERGSQSAI